MDDGNVLEILVNVCIFLLRDPKFLKDHQNFIIFIDNYTHLHKHDYIHRALRMFLKHKHGTKHTKQKRMIQCVYNSHTCHEHN